MSLGLIVSTGPTTADHARPVITISKVPLAGSTIDKYGYL
ncbi:hypothetical protein IQ22_00421 [Pseudomonas duriflava]|uniref:Uncharacterized protein n=1 Tax=Pseudomonas duriflava TaxID=459528 RepID=A0A562QR81_9PSED|nr:hypothetical protein IQ22_00421 [Pseudomonas duriflava]